MGDAKRGARMDAIGKRSYPLTDKVKYMRASDAKPDTDDGLELQSQDTDITHPGRAEEIADSELWTREAAEDAGHYWYRSPSGRVTSHEFRAGEKVLIPGAVRSRDPIPSPEEWAEAHECMARYVGVLAEKNRLMSEMKEASVGLIAEVEQSRKARTEAERLKRCLGYRSQEAASAVLKYRQRLHGQGSGECADDGGCIFCVDDDGHILADGDEYIDARLLVLLQMFGEEVLP